MATVVRKFESFELLKGATSYTIRPRTQIARDCHLGLITQVARWLNGATGLIRSGVVQKGDSVMPVDFDPLKPVIGRRVLDGLGHIAEYVAHGGSPGGSADLQAIWDLNSVLRAGDLPASLVHVGERAVRLVRALRVVGDKEGLHGLREPIVVPEIWRAQGYKIDDEILPPLSPQLECELRGTCNPSRPGTSWGWYLLAAALVGGGLYAWSES